MSKKLTHTKGPWLMLAEECDKPYIRVRGTALGRRYKIANVLTPIYEGVAPNEAEETRKNARLIAAAPELLDALMSVELMMRENGMTTHGLYQQVCDAMQRAVNFESNDTPAFFCEGVMK